MGLCFVAGRGMLKIKQAMETRDPHTETPLLVYSSGSRKEQAFSRTSKVIKGYVGHASTYVGSPDPDLFHPGVSIVAAIMWALSLWMLLVP